MPGQQTRRKNVRRKLNAMALEFHGKNVLLVDGKSIYIILVKFLIYALDSIVRGTTSKEIIQMARDAGAKKVYFASCAPPIRYPNVYGIDMPTRQELVAHGRNVEQVAQEIGADKVIYQDLDDLVQSVRRFNPAIKTFDTSVFDKYYVTGDIDDSYIAQLEGVRGESSKSRLSIDSDCVGLYNSFNSKQ